MATGKYKCRLVRVFPAEWRLLGESSRGNRIRSGVFQRPLTLILLQKYRDTNGRRIVIQIGGVYTTFCNREGIHLQKYAIEMGGVSRYFFTCIGVRGLLDPPD